MYSFVLLRTIHYIVNLRIRHPDKRIYICKFDLDAAYHRCHLAAATASECLSIFDNTLLMALQMMFGGSPCPSMWGFISDIIADICNSIIHNSHWNHNMLFHEISTTIEDPLPLSNDIPFHPGRPLAVDIPPNDIGKVDIYIDDSIGVALDISDNPRRVNYAILLVIHAFQERPTQMTTSQGKILSRSKNFELKEGWKKRNIFWVG
jgi:hypothetical protein